MYNLQPILLIQIRKSKFGVTILNRLIFFLIKINKIVNQIKMKYKLNKYNIGTYEFLN